MTFFKGLSFVPSPLCYSCFLSSHCLLSSFFFTPNNRTTIADDHLRGLSNSIKFGYQERFENGYCVCKPIFGYDVKGTIGFYDFTIIPIQAETVRLIFDLYLKDYTFTQIAKYLKENNHLNKYGNTNWTPPMIPYILSNEKYAGIVYMQKYFNEKYKTIKNNPDEPSKQMYAIEDHHEAIISLEVYHQAKLKLNSRPKRPRKETLNESTKDFISPILYCDICNNHYKKIVRKNYQGDEVITYRCGKNRYKEEPCHNSTIYPETFINLFISAYNDWRKHKDNGTDKTKNLVKLLDFYRKPRNYIEQSAFLIKIRDI